MNDNSLLHWFYSMALRIILCHSLASLLVNMRPGLPNNNSRYRDHLLNVKDPSFLSTCPSFALSPLSSHHIQYIDNTHPILASVWTSSRYQLCAARERPNEKKVVMNPIKRRPGARNQELLVHKNPS
ncbi:unnamed protein product [Fusarium graminearum]|uniref:Chromosome 3, complete genome n=1 Tax=Gibberella zeae (strain ATCC MYA-4620 / CBS 123657 / FGSC 9075 / NRRL 31084 / PH-1) TaxID=229533 RepID=I1S7Q7_GIBZE|nr:hypothetical protein FGSG_12882 [Fusarium graminearum PH-1]ESU12232.1 hypothetical protein FGSG_12882 [Fusarium graminearum PH-1]CEF88894.1 unnamed protein product [Fusarium graminearum]CZS84932.1 unnamed protein product [Fusarium graminearum]|eukprot:XP_011324808.1 hypothetical protein FGSG_12882 [Fusarium graminearum PH-1]